MLRRAVRGLDEMALEVLFIAVAAIVGAVAIYYALNSGPAARAERVRILGPIVSGARAVVGLVVHP